MVFYKHYQKNSFYFIPNQHLFHFLNKFLKHVYHCAFKHFVKNTRDSTYAEKVSYHYEHLLL